MTAKLYALAGLMALVATGTLTADVCGTRSYYQQSYAQTAYVAPVVNLALPLYGASYTGDGDAETKELLRALLAEIQAMRAEARGGPQAQAAPGKDPVAALTASCAACHTAGTKVKGEFEMFSGDGKPLKLNGPDRRTIEKRVREGTMPPPEKARLSAEDKAAVLSFVTGPPAPTPPPAAKLPPSKK